MRWLNWNNVALGTWLIVAPFALGYSSVPGVAGEDALLGMAIATFALWRALGQPGVGGESRDDPPIGRFRPSYPTHHRLMAAASLVVVQSDRESFGRNSVSWRSGRGGLPRRDRHDVCTVRRGLARSHAPSP